ncbi:ferredoxin reductase [Rhodococcus aerolatus]
MPLLERLAYPQSPDRYLELVDPTWSLREVRATVTEVDRSTPGSVTVSLRPNGNWRGHVAGQHVVLTVLVAGVRRSRCYSVTTSQHATDGLLELTARLGRTDDGRPGAVSGHLHERLAPGDVVDLTQAQGTFVLPDARPEHVLLVSGGSGITPVLSILRTLVDEGRADGGDAGRVTFLHYTRTLDEVPAHDELRDLADDHPGLRLVRVTTRSDEHPDGVRGHFSPAQLEALVPDWRRAGVYVCGSARLVSEVRALAEAEGVAIEAEQFDPPAAIVPTDGEITGEVSFSASGASAANSGRPLLEQAEALGLSPAYGCRMGICFSCTRRKTAGTTRHLHTGETTTEAEADIQLCVSVPVGGDVTIDL